MENGQSAQRLVVEVLGIGQDLAQIQLLQRVADNVVEKKQNPKNVTLKNAQGTVDGVIMENGQSVQRIVAEVLNLARDLAQDPLLLTAERNAAEKIRSRRGVTPKNAQEMVVGVIGENGQNVQRLVVEGLRHGKDPVQSQLLLMVAKSAVAKIQSRRSVTPKNAQGTADGLIGENGLSAQKRVVEE